MPRCVVCTAERKFEWREYDEPELTGEQVRIRSRFGAAKHGTELAFVKGYAAHRGRFDREMGLFSMERPRGGGEGGVGNMTVGEVVEIGPQARRLAEGDRVLIPGGFRETHIRGEGGCWKIPAEMPWKSAVCLDPADFAFAAVRDGHVRVGDRVAVFGAGAIGLMAVQIAKLAGAALVVAVEPLPNRRRIAGAVGADVLLDPAECDVGLELRKLTDRRGVDVAIEYSGSHQAMQAALRGVAYGGNVVAGAFPPPYPAGLDLGAEAHLNVPNIIFSRACSRPDRDHPRWDERRIFEVCLAWLIEGRLSGEEVVTPVVPFEAVADEYAKIVTEPDVYVKIGVEY